ncbi:DsbA family oxidoreductase [Peribacillus acanthi]|uniref:DsbA family oxidoreductase n=1 Tax=Peribacillus acanthi TaxID=2171554 RepID=UPI000D3E4B92|nr:DsbA family oxidoreductase [Peribacillus acanthi]
MKIEVWSDFVCPFCYIGKRRLEMALANFPNKEDVEVEFKSFELDSNAPKNSEVHINEALAKKYGMSVEDAKRANDGLKKQAATVGLDFNFDNMKPTNTFDAHRLTKYAKTVGKEKELTEKLLAAYFTESKNLGNQETLLDICESVGLVRSSALAVLHNESEFANDVRIDQAIAGQYGIRGVPYFIINQKYAISGAQPTETFISALQKVWDEENSQPILQELSSENGGSEFCTDEGCVVPDKEEDQN